MNPTKLVIAYLTLLGEVCRATTYHSKFTLCCDRHLQEVEMEQTTSKGHYFLFMLTSFAEMSLPPPKHSKSSKKGKGISKEDKRKHKSKSHSTKGKSKGKIHVGQ
jgi:hypothetical protein